MPKKTFENAEVAEAILIVQVKENQKSLLKQIEHGCKVQKPVAVYKEEITKEHGRIEQRTYEVFDVNPMLKNWKKDWPYIRQITRVTRNREEVRKKNKGPSVSASYYASNRNIDVQECAGYIREHWWTENKYHYVKDVAFHEDRSVKHTNPYIYAKCIDFALNIMRANNAKNIKQTLRRNALDFMTVCQRLV